MTHFEKGIIKIIEENFFLNKKKIIWFRVVPLLFKISIN